MKTTAQTSRRLALLPIEDHRKGRPAVRRYRLGRVIDDIGAAVAAPRTQAPASGVRAP